MAKSCTQIPIFYAKKCVFLENVTFIGEKLVFLLRFSYKNEELDNNISKIIVNRTNNEQKRTICNLIQASMEHRVERVARKQNITPEEARKIIN